MNPPPSDGDLIVKLYEQRDLLLTALKRAVETGMVPTSSAKEGGAAKYSSQVIAADHIRAVIAKVESEL